MTAEPTLATEIRVRGRVQGVGFRPTVWRIARELGLNGEVLNDAEGVLIRVAGSETLVRLLVARLRSTAPPLARIERIESRAISTPLSNGGFRIADSAEGMARTEATPDAVICPACTTEILDPHRRRYRYPFTNCTHCGPRLSILTGIPYDRDATTMAPFAMCPACAKEYGDPWDRRFHAEAIACPSCGPKVELVRFAGHAAIKQDFPRDDMDAVGDLLRAGHIVALKGLGGYQLACDAGNAGAVQRLRHAKAREAKPFALMARDLAVIQRYCRLTEEEERQLTSPEGPIVLLAATGADRLPDAIAPGLKELGFMLPTTPLHVLALRGMDAPVVMTSGNLSDEPQSTDDDEARIRLSPIADYALVHDRVIANRVDDSVVRVMRGVPRLLRRARGFAPTPIPLPAGFDGAPGLLAMGGELKSAFCLLREGQAILSQHQGDLEDARTYDDYCRNLCRYTTLFDHRAQALAADCHPEYLSSKLARKRAHAERIPLIEVQHHHAHVAACLAENQRALDAPPVLGIVLDGLGWGADGTFWGGEFLLADYRQAERLGTFKPIAMPGGARAIHGPWRSLYAHLLDSIGWAELTTEFDQLDFYRFLADKPLHVLDGMLRKRINTPLASSCGRLFDAVAAALDVCREAQRYEGEAACRLEAMADKAAFVGAPVSSGYPFDIERPPDVKPAYLGHRLMWRGVLNDLASGTPVSIVAARFHLGLARAIVQMTQYLAPGYDSGSLRFDTVALSGGCFQNALLFNEVAHCLEAEGYTVLTHARVPANDGGLALGQAAVGAARLIAGDAQ